jgi:hypothetical protein
MLGPMSRHLPGRVLCVWAVAALALSWAGPTVAAAATGGEGNAFNELSQGGAGGEEESTVKTKSSATKTTAASSSSSSSNTDTVLLFGLGAAVVLLGGIAFVILRDARSVAPVGDGPVMGRSAHDPAVTLRKRRAKAKAARRQRKRNR